MPRSKVELFAAIRRDSGVEGSTVSLAWRSRCTTVSSWSVVTTPFSLQRTMIPSTDEFSHRARSVPADAPHPNLRSEQWPP